MYVSVLSHYVRVALGAADKRRDGMRARCASARRLELRSVRDRLARARPAR
jgi:hypothetical protein